MTRIVPICIALAAAVLTTPACVAETYPARPVRMIVPYAPGGNADIQARYMAETLTATTRLKSFRLWFDPTLRSGRKSFARRAFDSISDSPRRPPRI